MRGAVLLLSFIAASTAAPAKTDNPDSEVELVQPVENDPTEVDAGNETDTGTFVIVVGPSISEDDDQQSNSGSFGGFGFGNLPSLAGSFGGFEKRRPEVTNFDLSNLFGNSESKISLSNIFGADYDDSGVTLSVSLEPADEVPQNSFSGSFGPDEENTQFSLSGIFGEESREKGFSLTDLVKSISSGNQQPHNFKVGEGGFGFGNRRPQFGLGGFGTRNKSPGGFGSGNRNQGGFNLGDFLGSRNQRPQNSFKNIFGPVSLKPQLNLGDIFGSESGSPQVVFGNENGNPSLGIFGGLTGKPWTSFRNIFVLYNRPELRGFKEIFGPVYGHIGGCGLCQLFTSENVHGDGATVTVEIVGENPDYLYEEPDTDSEVVVEETIPGGSVVRINETTIRVLDENGDGIYFLLNTDPASDEDVYETEDDNMTDENEYEETEGGIIDKTEYESTDEGIIDDNEYEPTDDGILDENDETDDGIIDENDPTDDSIIDGNEYEPTDDGIAAENGETDDGIIDENYPTDDGIIDENEYEPTDNGMPNENGETDYDIIDENVESVTETNPDVDLTTQFDVPAIFDEGRFDIANDKIINENEEDTSRDEDDQAKENTETTKDDHTDIADERKNVDSENDNTEMITEPTFQEDTAAPNDSEDNTTVSSETETEVTETSPTLNVDNIDDSLL